MHLAANAKFFDKVEVLFAIFASNILQVALALTNHLEQTTASGKILLVDLEVLGQFLDVLGQNAHLYGRATGVFFFGLQTSNNRLLLLT